MDALLRAALAMPDCPITPATTTAPPPPLASVPTTSHFNGFNGPPSHQHHQQQHHYQLPDKHILAARLRAQLGRAAQRANLSNSSPPSSKPKPAHHLQLHHHNNLHTIPSVPSTPTPTSSCADPDTDTDHHPHHRDDLYAFTATWTLASGPLSPPASIARFSCAPTHLIPQVTLPRAAHLGPHGEPMAAVSHHLASECRSVASIHVVTSNGFHGARATNGARRHSFVYYDDRGDSEDEMDEDDESDDEWVATVSATSAAAATAAASSSSRGAHVPPAAYAEMEEAAWTILRMMQDSQVLPSQQTHEHHPAAYPSSLSSPSTPSSPSEPDAMDIDPAPVPAAPIDNSNPSPAGAIAHPNNTNAEGDSTIEIDTPTKQLDPLTSSPPASTLTHRLALTRRRVQSELAHRRPAALTLIPNGLGPRRGSLSSAGSSPSTASASSPAARIQAPATPTSAGARARRRSLSASEHLIMGQLARSPLAIAFSKQQAAAVAEPAATLSPTHASPATATLATTRRPMLTSAASDAPRRPPPASPSPSSTSASASSSTPRIPRELANLADFLKPPPHESEPAAAKMAASPLSASLLASGAPVDLLVASVVASTGVGARRAAAAARALSTIDESESGGAGANGGSGAVKNEPVESVAGVVMRKRTRRGAAAAAIALRVASDEIDEAKVAEEQEEEEEEQAPARKRARKAAAPPAPAANGRSRAATTAAASATANGNGRRGRGAAAKPASSPPVGRVTRGRAAGRTVVKDEDESLSDADGSSGGEDEMDDTASLSSVPSSPEL